MTRESAISQLLGRPVDFADGQPVIHIGETSPSDDAIAQVIADATEASRIVSIEARVRELKNASLGFGPNQTGDTLRSQVNLAIGGLLKMNQQQKVAMATLLIGSNICSVEQFEAAYQSALTPEEHDAIAKRLAYYAWINQVDAHAAALKADPELAENFPPAPTL